MEQDIGWQPMLDYLRARANRPFGDVEARSGRLLQAFSFAGQQAAENLLVKARRALDDQNGERACALVERAVRLPFDEHEGGSTGRAGRAHGSVLRRHRRAGTSL